MQKKPMGSRTFSNENGNNKYDVKRNIYAILPWNLKLSVVKKTMSETIWNYGKNAYNFQVDMEEYDKSGSKWGCGHTYKCISSHFFHKSVKLNYGLNWMKSGERCLRISCIFWNRKVYFVFLVQIIFFNEYFGSFLAETEYTTLFLMNDQPITLQKIGMASFIVKMT